MTLQKSSLNVFMFTFVSALKGNFILPLLNLAALVMAVPVQVAFFINSMTSSYRNTPTGESIDFDLTNTYRYFLFNEYGQQSQNLLIHAAVIGFSVMLGIVMFRFIANKKTVNVYYSLGITRTNLFVAKYAAGLLMLFVSILLPFAAGLVINIATFGSSAELWTVIVFHILGYWALSATAYSLTAAVFSGVGTIVEGVTFSGILLLAPTMLLYCVQFLMAKLTHGTPFGHFYDTRYNMSNSLSSSLSDYNPILFLFKRVSTLGSLSRTSAEAEFVWEAPDFTGVVLWLFAAAALFLGALWIFRRRKAEICGFLGMNRVLNFTATFVLGFFPLCIAVYAIDLRYINILVGFALFAAIYAVIDFALIRNLREWAKGFKKLPLHVGIAALIVLVFATGLFGYSSRIPKAERIESIEISGVGYTGIINPLGSGGYIMEDFLFRFGNEQPIDGFTSENDIKIISRIHKLIADTGKLDDDKNSAGSADSTIKKTSVRIVYNLKNGRRLFRYYDNATPEILNALLTVEETDRYKELILRNLTVPVTDKDAPEVSAAKNTFQGEGSGIFAYPSLLNKATLLPLDAQQRHELLDALAQDLIEQTIEERYFPKKPALGAIRFALDYGYLPDSGYPGEKPFVEESIPEFPDKSDEWTMSGLAGYGGASIVITEDMQRTIAFIEKYAFTSFFENADGVEIVSAQVILASQPNEFFYFNEVSHHFMGGWNKNKVDYGLFFGAYTTSDAQALAAMVTNAHIAYYNRDDGYFVKFTLSDGNGYVTMFVPTRYIPESVAAGVAATVPPKDGYYYY